MNNEKDFEEDVELMARTFRAVWKNNGITPEEGITQVVTMREQLQAVEALLLEQMKEDRKEN